MLCAAYSPIINPTAHQYTMLNQILEVLDHQAYLGITITETLNWKMLVLNVKNKANKTLGFIKRNLRSCPERIKAQAYASLVRPSLEYACASWDPYRKYQIDILEQVQRRAARFVTNTYSREEGCVSQALNSLQWPTLQHRRRIARLCMLYKTLNNEAEITVA